MVLVCCGIGLVANSCKGSGGNSNDGGLSVSDATGRCQRALDQTVKQHGGIAGTVVIDPSTVSYSDGTLTAHVTDPQDGNVSMGSVTCTGLDGLTTHVSYEMGAP